MRNRQRGASLATLLVFSALAALAAVTMASVTSANLNRAQRYLGSEDALFLAESAVSETLSHLHDSGRFGQANEVVRVQPSPDDPDRYAVVTFDREHANGLPWSTNNVRLDAAGVGWGNTPVPAGTVHVLARGFSHGVDSTLEVMVTTPVFPFVVASSGPLRSSSGLVVKGATQSSKASIGCNAAINIRGEAEISGDVVAAGEVSLPPDAVVGGTIRNSQVDLPRIDTARYDPSGKADAVLQPARFEGNVAFNGLAYTAGGLQVQGDIRLDGGLLYVNGDLKVAGGLRGRGTIVVRGKATIDGGVDLTGQSPGAVAATADNMVALLCDGDVALHGTSDTQRYFEGLVYTNGNFTAQSIAILGVFVAAGSNIGPNGRPSAGAMQLDDVTVMHVATAGEPPVLPPSMNQNNSNPNTPPPGGRSDPTQVGGGAKLPFPGIIDRPGQYTLPQSPQSGTSDVPSDPTADSLPLSGTNPDSTGGLSSDPSKIYLNRFIHDTAPIRVIRWRQR